jgi:hypothetical protein
LRAAALCAALALPASALRATLPTALRAALCSARS